jgi:hypothetical protein
LKHYDHALAQDLSSIVRPIVQAQRDVVVDNLSTLRGRAGQQRAQHA